MKISFLMAAHNEEKIIGRALENLYNLPYDNYEVLIGLDGCTDKTEDIVKDFMKRSKKFKYYKFNLRKGKPPVINKLVEMANGKIIIIHDADWIFKVNKKNDLIDMIKWFNDPNLGGIAESFPIEWSPEKIKKNNSIAFLSIVWTSYFWIEYLKNKFSIRRNGNLYANPNNKIFPFELNIMRKNLYKKNETLGDAWERAEDVLKSGYSLRILEDMDLPRMHSSYNKAKFKDLIKQKQRTAISREQLLKKYPYFNFNLANFHFPLLIYLLYNIHKTKRIRAVLGVGIWLIIMGTSMFLHQTKKLHRGTRIGWIKKKYKPGTYEGWRLRANRY